MRPMSSKKMDNKATRSVWGSATVVIDKRFCGPPNSANGGYACGILAGAVEGSAEVTLRAPPPLGRPLRLAWSPQNTAELEDGSAVLGTAHGVHLEWLMLPRSASPKQRMRRAGHPMPAAASCANHYAAARMYETPSRLSDAELERRGLTRATLVRDLVRMCDRTKETGAPTPASTRGADRASAEPCANRGDRP